MRNLVLAAAVAVSFGAVASQALAAIDERRVALVIGNQAYRYAGELSQTIHDANEIARVLTEVGFDVMLVHDGDRRAMQQALNQFRRELRGADVALVYYSGHGMEFDGENYLAPVSARLGDRRTVDQEFIPLSDVLETVENGGAAFNMVILDACRNNPFDEQMEATRSGATVTPGLAPVQAPLGMVVAYATSPGNYSWEGGDGFDNSFYTEALVANIEREGLEIGQVLRETRRMVVEWTNGEQVPWEHSAMIGEFYFRPAGEVIAEADQGEMIHPRTEDSSLFGQSSLFGNPGNDNVPQQQQEIAPNVPSASATLATVSPESLQAILAGLGYDSQVEYDDNGATLFLAGNAGIPGDGVGIWFYDCQGSECASIELWTYFEGRRPVDLRLINRWNSEQRWSIASVEEDKLSVLTLDINITGTTAEHIADLIALFGTQAVEFQSYVL